MALQVFSSMGRGFYSTELNEHKLHLEYAAARLKRYMSVTWYGRGMFPRALQ